jgi:hypothetical protein
MPYPVVFKVLIGKFLSYWLVIIASEKKSKDKHKSKHHRSDRHLVSPLTYQYDYNFDVWRLSMY